VGRRSVGLSFPPPPVRPHQQPCCSFFLVGKQRCKRRRTTPRQTAPLARRPNQRPTRACKRSLSWFQDTFGSARSGDSPPSSKDRWLGRTPPGETSSWYAPLKLIYRSFLPRFLFSLLTVIRLRSSFRIRCLVTTAFSCRTRPSTEPGSSSHLRIQRNWPTISPKGAPPSRVSLFFVFLPFCFGLH